VLRKGIYSVPATTLEVADACSGIRSLMSLITLSVAYAFFLPMRAWKRWIVIFAAVPIAIATNAFRVIGTGIYWPSSGGSGAQGSLTNLPGWWFLPWPCCSWSD